MSILDVLAEATKKSSAAPVVKRVRADGAVPFFGRRALYISTRTVQGAGVWLVPLRFLQSGSFVVDKETAGPVVKVIVGSEDRSRHVFSIGPLVTQDEADALSARIAAALKPSRWRYLLPTLALFVLWLALSSAQVQTQPQPVRQSSLLQGSQGAAGPANYPVPPALVSTTPVPSGMVIPQGQRSAPPAAPVAPVITQAAPGAATTDKNDPFGLKIAPAGK